MRVEGILFAMDKSRVLFNVNTFTLTGNTFPTTPENMNRFHQWWRAMNWEHFLVFWLLGLFTMVTLSLLAYSTTFGNGDNAKGIHFILIEATAIGQATLPMLGTNFFGITVFSLGFDQPLTLIIFGAIINAFSMFVYTGILLYLNNRTLPKELRPRLWRNFMLAFTFIFFGSFCAVTAYMELIAAFKPM